MVGWSEGRTIGPDRVFHLFYTSTIQFLAKHLGPIEQDRHRDQSTKGHSCIDFSFLRKALRTDEQMDGPTNTTSHINEARLKESENELILFF